MDDSATSRSRLRAMIALGLAGVVLAVNVLLALAWREDRRDRFDGVRSEIEERLEQRRDGEHGAPSEGPDAGERGPGGRPDAPHGAGRPGGPGTAPWSERRGAGDDAEGEQPGRGRTEGDREAGGTGAAGEGQGGSA